MKELEDLKVGDNVIVGGAYSYCRIRQVEKVTKKHIVVEGNKFSKEFGWIDGCSSYTSDNIRINQEAPRNPKGGRRFRC